MEIKLRLASQAAHARAAEALRPAFRETHQQENVFFDGAARELSARRCVMRCRFYNVDKRALLTVKARAPAARARAPGLRAGGGVPHPDLYARSEAVWCPFACEPT